MLSGLCKCIIYPLPVQGAAQRERNEQHTGDNSGLSIINYLLIMDYFSYSFSYNFKKNLQNFRSLLIGRGQIIIGEMKSQGAMWDWDCGVLCKLLLFHWLKTQVELPVTLELSWFGSE